MVRFSCCRALFRGNDTRWHGRHGPRSLIDRERVRLVRNLQRLPTVHRPHDEPKHLQVADTCRDARETISEWFKGTEIVKFTIMHQQRAG